MTIGRASSRRLLIDDLGWGHKLGKWQTAKTFDNMSYYCTALLVHTFHTLDDVSFKCFRQ